MECLKTKALVEFSLIYIEGKCPDCGGGIPTVIQMPGFFPMNVHFYLVKHVGCASCGRSFWVEDIFGKYGFNTHRNLKPFFKRAHRVRLLADYEVEIERGISLEEAWITP